MTLVRGSLLWVVVVLLSLQLSMLSSFARSIALPNSSGDLSGNEKETKKPAIDDYNEAHTLHPPSKGSAVENTSDGESAVAISAHGSAAAPTGAVTLRRNQWGFLRPIVIFFTRIANFFRKLFGIPLLPLMSSSSPQSLSGASDGGRGGGSTTGGAESRLTHWGGVRITPEEIAAIDELSKRCADLIATNANRGQWLREVKPMELLRFLRTKNGDLHAAWKMIEKHAEWRESPFGADSKFTKEFFVDSPLQNQIFWLGENADGCPVLVIRTQMHDGIYYNEDPRVFTSFVVSVLERGKELYGVGVSKQFCVLMDRGGLVWRNGKKKIEKLDMGVIPNLVELLRYFYNTMMDNYPDLLDTVKIAPASWFFSMCYKVTSRVMEKSMREKFSMVKQERLARDLHPYVHPRSLPKHLGGYSSTYTDFLDIQFDEAKANFPPVPRRKGGKKDKGRQGKPLSASEEADLGVDEGESGGGGSGSGSSSSNSDNNSAVTSETGDTSPHGKFSFIGTGIGLTKLVLHVLTAGFLFKKDSSKDNNQAEQQQHQVEKLRGGAVCEVIPHGLARSMNLPNGTRPRRRPHKPQQQQDRHKSSQPSTTPRSPADSLTFGQASQENTNPLPSSAAITTAEDPITCTVRKDNAGAGISSDAVAAAKDGVNDSSGAVSSTSDTKRKDTANSCSSGDPDSLAPSVPPSASPSVSTTPAPSATAVALDDYSADTAADGGFSEASPTAQRTSQKKGKEDREKEEGERGGGEGEEREHDFGLEIDSCAVQEDDLVEYEACVCEGGAYAEDIGADTAEGETSSTAAATAIDGGGDSYAAGEDKSAISSRVCYTDSATVERKVEWRSANNDDDDGSTNKGINSDTITTMGDKSESSGDLHVTSTTTAATTAADSSSSGAGGNKSISSSSGSVARTSASLQHATTDSSPGALVESTNETENVSQVEESSVTKELKQQGSGAKWLSNVPETGGTTRTTSAANNKEEKEKRKGQQIMSVGGEDLASSTQMSSSSVIAEKGECVETYAGNGAPAAAEVCSTTTAATTPSTEDSERSNTIIDGSASYNTTSCSSESLVLENNRGKTDRKRDGLAVATINSPSPPIASSSNPSAGTSPPSPKHRKKLRGSHPELFSRTKTWRLFRNNNSNDNKDIHTKPGGTDVNTKNSSSGSSSSNSSSRQKAPRRTILSMLFGFNHPPSLPPPPPPPARCCLCKISEIAHHHYHAPRQQQQQQQQQENLPGKDQLRRTLTNFQEVWY